MLCKRDTSRFQDWLARNLVSIPTEIPWLSQQHAEDTDFTLSRPGVWIRCDDLEGVTGTHRSRRPLGDYTGCPMIDLFSDAGFVWLGIGTNNRTVMNLRVPYKTGISTLGSLRRTQLRGGGYLVSQ